MNILGYDYTVSLSSVRKMDALGNANGSTLEILIADDLPIQQKHSTMIHEIVEAINWHLGLRLPHKVISALETGLFQALTANGVDLSPLLREEM